jgi:glycosyltransferase involved in cell wall biosynthesis
MRLGIIARSDNTGLGNQTRELVKMLNPDRILLIDSRSFNSNKQHPEWYAEYQVIKTNGFPKGSEISAFLREVDVVLSCETFYNTDFATYAKKKNVKTILQYNYEFLENVSKPDAPLPDIFLAPSLWNLDKMIELFGNKTIIKHLPPPTDASLFDAVRENNMSKNHNRLLHIGGKKAARDRNGTETVIEMLKYSKTDYELVIKTQTPLDIKCDDSRLTIDTGNPENREDMYDGYDAMLLPRRYAGLCLPMNEALLSGMPVFMTNLMPNSAILPPEWLINAEKIDQFRAKSMIDVHAGDPKHLAKLVDNYMNTRRRGILKQQALSIGIENFSAEILKPKYLEIFN